MTNNTIPNHGFTAKEVEETALTGFISYQRLMRLLTEQELKGNETLVGIELGQNGITLKIKSN